MTISRRSVRLRAALAAVLVGGGCAGDNETPTRAALAVTTLAANPAATVSEVPAAPAPSATAPPTEPMTSILPAGTDETIAWSAMLSVDDIGAPAFAVVPQEFPMAVPLLGAAPSCVRFVQSVFVAAGEAASASIDFLGTSLRQRVLVFADASTGEAFVDAITAGQFAECHSAWIEAGLLAESALLGAEITPASGPQIDSSAEQSVVRWVDATMVAAGGEVAAERRGNVFLRVGRVVTILFPSGPSTGMPDSELERITELAGARLRAAVEGLEIARLASAGT